MKIKYTRTITKECEIEIDVESFCNNFDSDPNWVIKRLDKEIDKNGVIDYEINDVETEMGVRESNYLEELEAERAEEDYRLIMQDYWNDIYRGISQWNLGMTDFIKSM